MNQQKPVLLPVVEVVEHCRNKFENKGTIDYN